MTKHRVLIEFTSDTLPADICDIIAGRVYGLDCVEKTDVTASIVALQPAQHGEPVAWMSPGGGVYRTRFEAVQNFEQMVTPLYAEPQPQGEKQ